MGETRAVRFVEEALERMEGSPLTLLNAALDAFATGFSVQELVFEEDRGRIWLRAARPKPASQFGLDLDPFGRLRSLRLQLPGESPRSLDPRKFVLYRYRSGAEHPAGRPDLEAALPHFESKQMLLKAWRAHLVRYAMPTMVARCGPGVTAAEQSEILAVLDSMHRKSAVAVPSEIEVAPIQTPASGVFEEAIDFHNREITRAILGQTLATDEGRRVGSMAMGRVHLEVLRMQLRAIRRELADSVMTEQVLRPLVELNLGPGPLPRFEFLEPEPSDLVV